MFFISMLFYSDFLVTLKSKNFSDQSHKNSDVSYESHFLVFITKISKTCALVCFLIKLKTKKNSHSI